MSTDQQLRWYWPRIHIVSKGVQFWDFTVTATSHTFPKSRASLSSDDSAASLWCWYAHICCSCASLSSDDSAASLWCWYALFYCSRASLSSDDSAASLWCWHALFCCSRASLSSTLRAARLALSVALRFLSLSSLCSAVSLARRSYSRSLLRLKRSWRPWSADSLDQELRFPVESMVKPWWALDSGQQPNEKERNNTKDQND